MPPSASSNFPRRAATAPVNAPRSWPNSSLSMSSAGTAAQLSFTNGPSRRRECSCRARATSSLPEPFSPVTSTRPSEGAARRMSSNRRCMAAPLPTMSSRPASRRRAAFSARRLCMASAFFTATSSLSFSVMGFSR